VFELAAGQKPSAAAASATSAASAASAAEAAASLAAAAAKCLGCCCCKELSWSNQSTMNSNQLFNYELYTLFLAYFCEKMHEFTYKTVKKHESAPIKKEICIFVYKIVT
jgi:hypothetical protein